MSTPGTAISYPIDLTESPPIIDVTDDTTDHFPTIASATAADLLPQPSASLRYQSSPPPGPLDPTHLGLASPQLSHGFDGRKLRSSPIDLKSLETNGGGAAMKQGERNLEKV